jgi:hypothetical protein
MNLYYTYFVTKYKYVGITDKECSGCRLSELMDNILPSLDQLENLQISF